MKGDIFSVYENAGGCSTHGKPQISIPYDSEIHDPYLADLEWVRRFGINSNFYSDDPFSMAVPGWDRSAGAICNRSKETVDLCLNFI
jgi:hypothetical protein